MTNTNQIINKVEQELPGRNVCMMAGYKDGYVFCAPKGSMDTNNPYFTCDRNGSNIEAFSILEDPKGFDNAVQNHMIYDESE